MKINGERHCLWPAIDHAGEVLERFVTKTREKKAALQSEKKMEEEGRAVRLALGLAGDPRRDRVHLGCRSRRHSQMLTIGMSWDEYGAAAPR